MTSTDVSPGTSTSARAARAAGTLLRPTHPTPARPGGGSPAGTTRGFGTAEFRETGRLIAEVLRGLVEHGDANDAAERAVKAQVEALCARFPIYSRAA